MRNIDLDIQIAVALGFSVAEPNEKGDMFVKDKAGNNYGCISRFSHRWINPNEFDPSRNWSIVAPYIEEYRIQLIPSYGGEWSAMSDYRQGSAHFQSVKAKTAIEAVCLIITKAPKP